MSRKYFGTDGLRGRVGAEPMTPDFLVRLGYAIGLVLSEKAFGGNGEVLISKDTRLSGYMVESALEAGLSAAGRNVLLSGPLPTSAVSYLTPALRLSAGIVISASHNPHYDNGIKLFDSAGGKLPDALELQIEDTLERHEKIAFSGKPGRARRLDGGAERYIEFCKRAFPPDMNLLGQRIVADCAHGAAYHVAPPVLHELGAEVRAIGVSPDGTNINVDAGTLSPQSAVDAVLAHGADAGIVLDGDADRVLLIDEKGVLHDGDALLYLIAQALRRRGKAPSGIVGTVLSNLALERKLAELNIQFHRADVGDRYVNEALARLGWQMGGEPSGHLILRRYHHTGDGIIAGLQALAAMRDSGKPLSALLAGYQTIPQQSRNIAVDEVARGGGNANGGGGVLQQPAVKDAMSKLINGLGGDIRLVARPSGTEPLIRLMAEGEDTARVAQALADAEEIITGGGGGDGGGGGEANAR